MDLCPHYFIIRGKYFDTIFSIFTRACEYWHSIIMIRQGLLWNTLHLNIVEMNLDTLISIGACGFQRPIFSINGVFESWPH